jgi:hypothetical protein
MRPGVVCTIGGLLLLTGGCSLANSFDVQDRLVRVPRMTCAQFARNGPPADGQVTLTDLKLSSRGAVAWRNRVSPGDLDLYVPACPADLAQEPEPADLAFLLQVWDDDQWQRMRGQPASLEVTCWARRGARIVKFTQGPGQVEEWARDRLEQKYPGIRLGNVWVLTVGHGYTPTLDRAQSAFRYGIGELVAGLAVLAFGLVQAWRCGLERRVCVAGCDAIPFSAPEPDPPGNTAPGP